MHNKAKMLFEEINKTIPDPQIDEIDFNEALYTLGDYELFIMVKI